MTYHDFVYKLLTLIGYTDDKDEFIDRFMQNVQLQSIVNLRETLEKSDQTILDEAIIAAGSDKEKMNQAFRQYFTREQIHELSNETALEEIGGLLEALEDKLTDAQKHELDSLFATLQ